MTRQDFIINTVAEFYGLNPTDILGQSRKAKIIRARFVAMAFIHNEGVSQQETANYFDGRHHSCVHHAMSKLNDRSIPGVTSEIRELKAVLGKPKPVNHLLIADGVSVAYEHNQDSFGLYNMTVTIFE